MQLHSAEAVCKESDEWQNVPLPKGLKPEDFDYLKSNNRYWTYRYALASAMNFKGKSGNAVTTNDGSAFILGDSGGYQIGKGSFSEAKAWKKLSASEIMAAWYSSETRFEIIKWCEINCDYAMTIDIPLWVARESEKNSPFRKCSENDLIEITIDNLRTLSNIRGRWSAGGKSCKYLNVLQGETEDAEQHWYDEVKAFKFDGWSLAGSVGVDGGPYRILRRLLLLADANQLDKGYDWLHVLKIGMPRWAPVLTAIQRAVRKNINERFTISYDSSNAYLMGGKLEQYYWSQPFTSDPKTWTLKLSKLPSTYAYAVEPTPIALGNVQCGHQKCFSCSKGKPHLPAPLESPIAKHLYMQDLLINKAKKATRRGGKLFDETLSNHNVYTIVDAMIRANDAVFKNNGVAPQHLKDACGVINDLFNNSTDWNGKLEKHRDMLESALGHKS